MSRGHRSYSFPRDLPDPGPTRPGRWPHPLTVLTLLSGLFILYGTTIPFERVAHPVPIAEGWSRALDELGERSSRTDRVANVLLFLPWGALLTARLARAGARPTESVLLALATGAGLSVGVETLQINLRMRVTSATDVMTNTAGAALGGIAGWLAAAALWPEIGPRLRRAAESRPLAVLALAAWLGWGLVDLAPFVPTLDVGQFKHSIKAARPIPFGPSIGGARPADDPWALAVEALDWALIGGLIALALREGGLRGPPVVIGTAALAAAARAAIELAQLIVPGHASDATQILASAAGAALAASAVALRPGPPARSWAVPALAAWLAAAVIDGARPFDAFGPPGPLRGTAFFPFYSYFWTPPPAALTTAAEKVASTVPLGLLLAALSRRVGPMVAGLAGGAFGLAIEAAQFFNAERTPDLTDVFLAAAGASLGATALRAWPGPARTAARPR